MTNEINIVYDEDLHDDIGFLGSMKRINSIKDPVVVEARKLQSASHRKATGKALLFGVEQLQWACDAKLPVECVFVEQGQSALLADLHCHTTICEVSSGIMKKISDTRYVVPCMAIVSVKSSTKVDDDFIVVMDNMQDFGNIGSIVRTAQAFSVDQLIVSGMQTDLFQRKIIDASRGQIFRSTTMQSKDDQATIAYLKKHGYQIVVTSPHAKHLQSQIPLSSRKVAMVIGNETTGASKEFLDAADLSIQIPMSLQVESLNASVAAGISIYELKFKQVLMMLKEKIFADFGRQVNVTGKLIRMAFDRSIKACTDLSGMQVILMMIMHCDGHMSDDQVSKDMAVFAEQLDDFMQPLLDRGYVQHQQNTYTLVDKGIQFLAEVWPIAQKTHEKIMSEMSVEERQQFSALLAKVQQGCRKIIDHG